MLVKRTDYGVYKASMYFLCDVTMVYTVSDKTLSKYGEKVNMLDRRTICALP